MCLKYVQNMYRKSGLWSDFDSGFSIWQIMNDINLDLLHLFVRLFRLALLLAGFPSATEAPAQAGKQLVEDKQYSCDYA